MLTETNAVRLPPASPPPKATAVSACPFALARSSALADEHFRTLRDLARRVHALGPDAPIAITPATLGRRGMRGHPALRLARCATGPTIDHFLGYCFGPGLEGELGAARLAAALEAVHPADAVAA